MPYAYSEKKVADNQSLAVSFQTEEVKVRGRALTTIDIVTSGVTDNTGLFGVQKKMSENDDWSEMVFTEPITSLENADETKMIDIEAAIYSFRVIFTSGGVSPDGTCKIHINTVRGG